MTLDDLVVRYSYDAWANEKLFGVVSRLSPEEFTRSITGGWAAIRTTLVHIVSAEWGWVSRCGGKPDRGPRLDPANYATPAAVIDESRRVDGYARAFLARCQAAPQTRMWSGPLNGSIRLHGRHASDQTTADE